VGLSLAACVSAVFTGIFDDVRFVSVSTGVPTLLLGMLWAVVLRWPRTVDGSKIRWGWLASIPLAALDGGVACGLTMSGTDGTGKLGLGFVMGATMGVVFWLPALVVTLLCFGLPIVAAQRRAEKGLAGEERGESIVGLMCAGMSGTGLVLAALSGHHPSSAGLPFCYALGIAGLLAGGAAGELARRREVRRREFVARAEAGEIPGYRVDPTEEGKVLVRIVSQGEGYRVADFEEDVFDLGAGGEATRPRVPAR
jgi:hypothetical protein